MPSWPGSLPSQVLVDGFQEAVPDTLVRTEMDVGPARVRRRTTAGVRMLSCQQLMTWEQVEQLDDWVLNQLGGGALSFTWTHPRTGATVTMRFAAMPTWLPVAGGLRFLVSFRLEVLP